MVKMSRKGISHIAFFFAEIKSDIFYSKYFDNFTVYILYVNCNRNFIFVLFYKLFFLRGDLLLWA